MAPVPVPVPVHPSPHASCQSPHPPSSNQGSHRGTAPFLPSSSALPHGIWGDLAAPHGSRPSLAPRRDGAAAALLFQEGGSLGSLQGSTPPAPQLSQGFPRMLPVSAGPQSPSPRPAVLSCPPSIFSPHLSSAVLPQEGNTFLISFRRVVWAPAAPSPPAPALFFFSEVSPHFPPETPQLNISLLEGKGKSPRGR